MPIFWGNFKTRSAFHLFTVFLVISFLTSCGGGGGGDDDGPLTIDKTTTNIFTNDTYTDAEVSVDAKGDSIVRTKLAILFKPTATQEEVEGLLTRINATITASIAGARSISIRIPDPGTVNDLESIIADIESESFVEAVLKSIVEKTTAVPDNIDVTLSDVVYIHHHAAVGGTAAWNARNAAIFEPHVMVLDFFGAGISALSSFLDVSLSGTVASAHNAPSNHGYHVSGIINGSYGGPFTSGGLVTGMLPVHSRLNLIDILIDPDRKLSFHDTRVLVLQRASSTNATVVLNTSLGLDCQASTASNTCRERADMMKRGIAWADQVRAAGMENRLFQTISAGNRAAPAPDMRDAETGYDLTAATLMTDMVTSEGEAVPLLTNSLVVERLSALGEPREVYCLHDNSFVGGQVSAIGTSVVSMDTSGNFLTLSGTSMAAPQVAGLAAYMLAIDDSLTPQRIKEIILNTVEPVALGITSDCSDWPSAAPAINAYAAVLALDTGDALPGSASVRLAILDISSDGTTIDNDGNGQFNEFDLMYFIQEIDLGSQEKSSGTENVKYSRADLNGDGYDGGRAGYKKEFNLDIDYPPTYTTVTQNIEGEVREFDESSLSDDDILCYYAYSSLYTGSNTQRTNLLGSRCKAPKVAIYYEHTNQVFFPPALLACGNINDDVFDQRETYSTRPAYIPSTNPVPERPASHFWQPGDSNVDQTVLNANTIRRAFDPNGAFNNCDIEVAYQGVSEIDSTVELSQTGDSVNVNLSTISTSECWEWPLDDPGSEWSCSSAQSMSQFSADYDFKISAATSLNLNLNLSCTGPGLRIPGDTQSTFGPEVGFFIIRLNAAGERIPTNWGSGGIVIPQPIACYDGAPPVNVQQLITFNAPETPGDVDRVIISAYGSVGSFGNLGNVYYIFDPTRPVPSLGSVTNTSTMQGTVQLVPAN